MLAKCPIPRIRKIYESFTDPKTKSHLSNRVHNNKAQVKCRKHAQVLPPQNPPPVNLTLRWLTPLSFSAQPSAVLEIVGWAV